jgi:hypothetical protein
MDLSPQLQRIVDRPFPGETKESWAAIPLPERLRLLAHGHYLIELPPEDREILRSVPSWMAVGPELGYPEEWFNPQGWLLPKYRPGGGSHREYLWARHSRRFWQVAFDSHQAWLHQLGRRWGCLGLGVLGATVYFAQVFAVALLPRKLPDPWDIWASVALFLIGVPVLVLTGKLLVALAARLSWACAQRRLRQRVDRWAATLPD